MAGRAAAIVLQFDVRAAIVLSAFLCCALSAPGRAQWQALAELQRDGARVTASAVDLDSNTVVQQLNADTRLTPASLTKLAVAAAALKTWPADRAFQTSVVTAAEVRSGKLDGDLVLRGAGDPTLDDQALWNLAAQVKSAGITSVGGDLVVSPAPFGLVACETHDRCEALKRSDTAYNAPLASIGVDFGAWCVTVRPGLPRAAAEVQGCAGMRLPIAVDGSIRTLPAGGPQSYWVERLTTADGDRLRVGGNIPFGNVHIVYRAMSDPARGVGLLLREALREIGVEVAGAVIVSDKPLPANTYLLAQFEGLSLREQLGRMLRFSNNYIADVLTLDLAATIDKQPPTQLSAASRVLAEFVTPAQHAAPPLFSGSGLTPENQLSASDLVGMLGQQYRDARHFPAFYGALVVPRDSPFGFLRGGGAAWLDRVALKTGTMDNPFSVCGIAGYLRKRNGGWMAFAVIVNGGPRMQHVPLAKAMGAAREDVEALLARY